MNEFMIGLGALGLLLIMFSGIVLFYDVILKPKEDDEDQAD